jgi:hypothetical protein
MLKQMAVPTSIKLDDDTDPQRTEHFDDALAVGKASARDVLRGLVDAYNAYVTEHGHTPPFPVVILPLKRKP